MIRTQAPVATDQNRTVLSREKESSMCEGDEELDEGNVVENDATLRTAAE